jgi:hypothetical protein
VSALPCASSPTRPPAQLPHPPPLKDFVFNCLTAKYDEERGLWAYKLRDMLKKYFRGWFLVDLVRAVGVCLGADSDSRPLSFPVQVFSTARHRCRNPSELRRLTAPGSAPGSLAS